MGLCSIVSLPSPSLLPPISLPPLPSLPSQETLNIMLQLGDILESSVCFSGIKDKVAITTQEVTVKGVTADRLDRP